MSLEEIKGLIEQNQDNEDVKAYLQGLNPVTVEGVQKFVEENEDAKSWIDSMKDKHLSKGLETWKSNNLEKILDEEIKKRFPEKDPKDIELQKLQQEIENMKSEKLRESITNKAIKVANSKEIPLDLVDFLIGNDEETTLQNIEKLESVLNGHIQKAVEKRIGKDTHIPPSGGSGKTLTVEDIHNMSPEEINKNWDAIQKVMQR